VHTRRVITFLLGVWIGGSLLVGLFALKSFSSANLVLAAPIQPAAKIIEKLGAEDARLLLRHFALEETRSYLGFWGFAEMGIGLILIVLFFLSSQTRFYPIVLAAMMLGLAVFQHFAILPELSYRSREADFPPGNTNFSTQARVWTLGQVYVGTEAVKLVLAGVLTSYLFVFYARSGVRRRQSMSDAIEVDG
jgi:hypothetical protein